MAKDKPENSIGSWRIRRYYMFTVSAFAMASVAYSLYAESTSTVAEIAVQSSYWLLFGITLLYVFGVTIQDVIALKNGYANGFGLANTTTKTTKNVLETNTSSTVDNGGVVDGKPS